MEDSYELQCEMTEPGRDVAEGNMAYRIDERGGMFLVVEYLADEPFGGVTVEWCKTRREAERLLKEYVNVHG